MSGFPSRRAPPYNLHDRVLGEPDVSADQAIGQTLAVHGEHFLRLLVGGTLTDLAAQNDAAGLRSRKTSRERARLA
jgi:hypothetical protein